MGGCIITYKSKSEREKDCGVGKGSSGPGGASGSSVPLDQSVPGPSGYNPNKKRKADTNNT